MLPPPVCQRLPIDTAKQVFGDQPVVGCQIVGNGCRSLARPVVVVDLVDQLRIAVAAVDHNQPGGQINDNHPRIPAVEIVPGVEIDRYPNSPFVLVQLLLPDTYNLVGWLYGWQIAELAWQHVEHDDNSGGSYWVKSYKLWTMADLPTS